MRSTGLFADLLADVRLIVETKACKALTDDHTAQVIGYLCASRMEHVLLINFGAPKLQVKKLIFSHSEPLNIQDWTSPAFHDPPHPAG